MLSIVILRTVDQKILLGMPLLRWTESADHYMQFIVSGLPTWNLKILAPEGRDLWVIEQSLAAILERFGCQALRPNNLYVRRVIKSPTTERFQFKGKVLVMDHGA